jgi:hypothetical protein
LVRSPHELVTDHVAGAPGRAWTFLSNHLHVLACIDHDPAIRLRDVAMLVGITERAAQSMVADLAQEGYLTRVRVGRRNRYEIHRSAPLRHPLERGITVGNMLDILRRRYANGSANGSLALVLSDGASGSSVTNAL